jgi:hypothetical protein
MTMTYRDWVSEDHLSQVERWKRHGLSNEQIAKNIGISEQTFYNWKDKHVEFFEAIKKGREVIVCELENALIKRAKGYEIEEVVFLPERGGGVTEKHNVKHIPPDTTALIFALKNMAHENWRDRKETEFSGNGKVSFAWNNKNAKTENEENEEIENNAK